MAAREKVSAATERLRQAKGAFGPTIALTARRDYLAQSPHRARGLHDRADDPAASGALYVRIGGCGSGAREAAQGRGRLRAGTSAGRGEEAVASSAAARRSVEEVQQVLELTQSLYHAGRTDLDNVQRAQEPSRFADELFAKLRLQVRSE